VSGASAGDAGTLDAVDVGGAGRRGVRNGGLGGLGISRGQVQLSLALISQGDIDPNKEVEAREDAALVEPGLGLHGAGDGDPYVPLRLVQRALAGGDRAEMPTDRGLSGAAGIERDKGLVADLAIAIALPNQIPTFPGFCVWHFLGEYDDHVAGYARRLATRPR
jgi:hypothetical protein